MKKLSLILVIALSLVLLAGSAIAINLPEPSNAPDEAQTEKQEEINTSDVIDEPIATDDTEENIPEYEAKEYPYGIKPNMSLGEVVGILGFEGENPFGRSYPAGRCWLMPNGDELEISFSYRENAPEFDCSNLENVRISKYYDGATQVSGIVEKISADGHKFKLFFTGTVGISEEYDKENLIAKSFRITHNRNDGWKYRNVEEFFNLYPKPDEKYKIIPGYNEYVTERQELSSGYSVYSPSLWEWKDGIIDYDNVRTTISLDEAKNIELGTTWGELRKIFANVQPLTRYGIDFAHNNLVYELDNGDMVTFESRAFGFNKYPEGLITADDIEKYPEGPGYHTELTKKGSEKLHQWEFDNMEVCGIYLEQKGSREKIRIK